MHYIIREPNGSLEIGGNMEKLHYESFDRTSLHVDVFYPKDYKETKPKSMLILFFGGGWMFGTTAQFHQHAKELVDYGVVVALPHYRTYNIDGTTVDVAIKDATYAVEYLTLLAENIGIPQRKVILGGESAGGHLALSTMLLDQFINDELNYKDKIGRMLLLNPAVDAVEAEKSVHVLAKTPYPIEELSPLHNIKKLPPMMIFHGDQDDEVPIQTVLEFEKATKAYGNDCELIVYPGRPHGFVNYRTRSISDFYQALGQIVESLYANDYLTLDIRWED